MMACSPVPGGLTESIRFVVIVFFTIFFVSTFTCYTDPVAGRDGAALCAAGPRALPKEATVYKNPRRREGASSTRLRLFIVPCVKQRCRSKHSAWWEELTQVCDASLTRHTERGSNKEYMPGNVLSKLSPYADTSCVLAVAITFGAVQASMRLLGWTPTREAASQSTSAILIDLHNTHTQIKIP